MGEKKLESLLVCQMVMSAMGQKMEYRGLEESKETGGGADER